MKKNFWKFDKIIFRPMQNYLLYSMKMDMKSFHLMKQSVDERKYFMQQLIYLF